MSDDPSTRYLSAVKSSGLVASGTLDSLVSALRNASPEPISPQAIGSVLIQRGFLTDWQHAKLLRGRCRGFFLGNYKLLQPIGSGGMAQVYLAEQTRLKRRVAIKILPPELLRDRASYGERFLREARAVARLDHPNIVAAYEAEIPEPSAELGKPARKKPRAYLVLQYIQGKDFHNLVCEKGVLPPRQAVEYIRQAAAGLHHAHGRGLIHRDIKPANLMVDRTGVVKVMDLGLASLRESIDGSLTEKHQEHMLGTPDYMSPEQAGGQTDVDARADVYSLGCTLYFLLVGDCPFPQGTVAERLLKHRREMPPPLCVFRPDIPGELQTILNRMMAKRPEDRYATAADVEKVLADWLANRSTSSEFKLVETAKTRHSSRLSATTILWIVAGGAVAILGGGLLLLSGWH
jgi:serine/threonine-protein kinase